MQAAVLFSLLSQRKRLSVHSSSVGFTTLYTIIIPFEVTWKLKMYLLSFLKSKKVMFGDNNERKTLEGWKFVFPRAIKIKTFLLGPPEFSKNTCMPKRQILIGLCVPYNNRTIGETRITQLGRERGLSCAIYGRFRKFSGRRVRPV